MWVYQQAPQAEGAEVLPFAAQKEAAVDGAAIKTQERPLAQNLRPPKARHGGGQATRDCIFLAAAYLLGTAAAGVLQAICDAGQQESLGYYLSRWCALFALDGAKSAAVLFGCEYIAVAAAFTVLLFLGLSAFGPLPIFLFVMLYGTGSGLLAAQLFSGLSLKVLISYVLVAGVPLAVIAGCMCMFGASAMQVCAKLQALSFARHANTLSGVGARGLVGQYVLFVVSLAPVCGAATGLVYLANQLKIW